LLIVGLVGIAKGLSSWLKSARCGKSEVPLSFTKLCCFAIVPLFVLVTVALASQPPSHDHLAGKLAGRVLDQNEAVIPNVEILIESKNFEIKVMSDDEGKYAVELPTGSYRLSVVSPRFHKFRKKNVRVGPSRPAKLDILLKFVGPIYQ